MTILHFQFGTFYIEGENGSLFWDFILSTIGALIGVLGGLYIYFLQQWRQQDDTLKYVVSLLNSVIAHTKTQAKNCRDLSDALMQAPTNDHKLTFEANHDLKRITDKLNQESFYHAYLGEYGRHDASFTSFRKLYSEIDFIDQVIDQLKSYLEKEFYLIVEMKKKFVDYLEEGESKSMLLTVHPNYLHQEQIVVFLNSHYLKYRANLSDPNDIDYPLTAFVRPVGNFLSTYHSTKPECNDIVTTLRKAETRYNIVVGKSQALARELVEYYIRKLHEHANALEIAAAKLMEDFSKDTKHSFWKTVRKRFGRIFTGS